MASASVGNAVMNSQCIRRVPRYGRSRVMHIWLGEFELSALIFRLNVYTSSRSLRESPYRSASRVIESADRKGSQSLLTARSDAADRIAWHLAKVSNDISTICRKEIGLKRG